MPVPILMPALSPTMEEGTLAKWLVAEGDRVTAGDVVAEIETDKATMEVEAVDEGVVGRIAVAEGTAGVRVNAPIAFLLGEGETADSLDAAEPAEESREPAEAAPVAPVTPAPPVTRAPSSAPVVASPAGSSAVRPEPRAFASPLARRLAAEAGLDFAEITGSGPRGRVVKRDIEAALAARTAPAAEARPAPVYAPAPGADAVKAMYPEDSYEEIPLDSMRRVVAERLTQAKRTVPHFYLSVDVEVDALLGARARANASLAARGMKLSVNDYCIKGAALALRDVPDCNVAFADDRILRFRVVDVAVAVAVEGGLFTPVLRGVDGRQLGVDLDGDEGPRRTGAGAASRPIRVSGRFHHDLQSGDVRHPEFRRGDQSAAWIDSGPRRGGGAGGGSRRFDFARPR